MEAAGDGSSGSILPCQGLLVTDKREAWRKKGVTRADGWTGGLKRRVPSPHYARALYHMRPGDRINISLSILNIFLLLQTKKQSRVTVKIYTCYSCVIYKVRMYCVYPRST
jgi:hypothetical protein